MGKKKNTSKRSIEQSSEDQEFEPETSAQGHTSDTESIEAKPNKNAPLVELISFSLASTGSFLFLRGAFQLQNVRCYRLYKTLRLT